MYIWVVDKIRIYGCLWNHLSKCSKSLRVVFLRTSIYYNISNARKLRILKFTHVGGCHAVSIAVVVVFVFDGSPLPQKFPTVVQWKWRHVKVLKSKLKLHLTLSPRDGNGLEWWLWKRCRKRGWSTCVASRWFRAYVWNCYCSTEHCEFVLRRRCRYHKQIHVYNNN